MYFNGDVNYKESDYMENYLELVKAVITTVADDYRSDMRKRYSYRKELKTCRKEERIKFLDHEIKSLTGKIETYTKFLNESPWMDIICSDDTRSYILKKLKEECATAC